MLLIPLSASFVRRVGVRVQGPRPLHPRGPHRGGSWSAPVRRSNPPWAHRVWRSRRGVCERLGRLPGSGLAWRSRGWPCMARTSVDPAAASEAHRLRRHARRLADQGIWSSSRMPAGRLGSTDRDRCSQSPLQGVLGRCRRGRSTTGLNRNMVTTLSGRCAGEGPTRPARSRPSGFDGERTAAVARPRYARNAVC